MAERAPALAYAFGGGLGHLARVRAAARTLGLGAPLPVLCAGPFADDPRFSADLRPVQPPWNLQEDPAAFARWIAERLDEFRPDLLLVDCFPAGILGELRGLPLPRGIERHLLARLLRSDALAALERDGAPSYRKAWRCEALSPAQDRLLERLADEVLPLRLVDPDDPPRGADPADLARGWREAGRPVWLVVHSGPDEETAELLDWAEEHARREGARPRWVVVSPGHPLPGREGIERVDLHPAAALFPFADRIVSACGFNTMRQTRAFRDRHLALPLPRRFDDQFLRLRLAAEGRG